MLKEGDVILVDFDGVIVECKDPNGKDYYPQIGPLKPGIREFLDKCKAKGIIVEVWSARTNVIESNNPEYMFQGEISYNQIETFLKHNNIYYTAINRNYKPLGTHHAKWLLDDRSLNCKDGYEYSTKLFNEAT